MLLPMFSLSVAILLVAIPATFNFLNLRSSIGDSSKVSVDAGNFGVMTLPREKILSFAINSAAVRASHSIAAMNMPGFVGDILISLPTTWPGAWIPRRFTTETWRCISFPVFCVPGWWFVGRGLEAWCGSRKLRWPSFLLGSLLSLTFVVLLLGLRFGVPETDRADPDGAWIFVGMGLWAFLFGVLPCAWIKQRRTRATL